MGGGGGGIRTHGTLSRTPVFKTGAFDHSATPPQHAPHRGMPLILQTSKLTDMSLSRQRHWTA